jgi:hypothetical protein
VSGASDKKADPARFEAWRVSRPEARVRTILIINLVPSVQAFNLQVKPRLTDH